MMSANAYDRAGSIISSLGGSVKVKRIKKDNGLLEREEQSDKIILAEDDRQLILG